MCIFVCLDYSTLLFCQIHILNIVLRLLLQHMIEIVVIAIIFSSYILMINFALYHVIYIAALSSNTFVRLYHT